jgi:hypothetical protein
MPIFSTFSAGSTTGLGRFRKRAIAVAIDLYAKYVTLLLNGDGTNNAQNNTFLDSSGYNLSLTRNGNATQGTFSPFSHDPGYWSCNFPGSSNLTWSGTAIGSGAFTIECWFNVNAFATYTTIIGALSGGTNALALYLNTNTQIQLDFINVGNILFTVQPMDLNVWHHLVVVRDSSNNCTVFVDGVRSSSGSVTNSNNYSNSSVSIGYSSGATYFPGYISNLRIVTGSAVYSPTSSTLTVPTSPLTAVSGTQLLVFQNNRFVDSSTNNYTLTIAGTPSIQAFTPFEPTAAYSAATNGGSYYGDGSGDYLLNTTNGLNVNSGTNFTFECWLYRQSTFTGDQGTCFFAIGTEASNRIQFAMFGSAIRVEVYAGTLDFNGGTVPLNAWTHVAIVRSGTTITIYINGVSATSATWNNVVGNSGGFIVGANRSVSNYVNGYISDLRFLIGTALYTSTFTPPTAPLTAITNTYLLLNFTNAGIYDAAAKNDLETVGNAQVSTAQSKYGGSSIYVDGTGDWLVMPSNPGLNLGSGAYTIEFFYRPNEVANDVSLIGKYGSEWLVQYLPSAGPAFRFAINNNSVSDFTSTLSANTWYHIAVCRDSSGNLRMFKDGTQIGSTVTSGSGAASNITATTNSLYIGCRDAGTQTVNGYFDEVRITKGVARYVSNFSVPSAPFTIP